MTIREFLCRPEFSDIVILSGKQKLDTAISGINVIDCEDIHRWLLGGELVLTNGFLFMDNTALLNRMIENLHSANAAGLLIKRNRYISEIPAAAISIARELGFPLLQAPQSLKFSLVTKAFAERNETFSDFDEISNAFSNLALEEIDRRAVVNLLAGYSGIDVAFQDLLSNEYIPSKNCKHPSSGYSRDDISQLDQAYYTASINISKCCYGFLIAFGNKNALQHDTRFLIAARQAVNLLRFSVQLRLSKRNTRQLDRERLLQDLVFPKGDMSVQEMDSKLWSCGIAAGKPFAVLTVQPDSAGPGNTPAPDLASVLDEDMRTLDMQALWTSTGTETIILLQCRDGGEALAFAQALYERLSGRMNRGITIGIGRCGGTPALVHASYLEAVQAVVLGRRGKTCSVCAYDQMGAQRLLAASANLPEAANLVEQILGPLLAYDAAYPNSSLLPTLKAFADCDFHMGNTAKALFIHYNTLKYRYGKICEILNADLNDFQTRVRVFIALQLLKMRD